MALESLYAQVGAAPGQIAEGLQRNKLINANIMSQQGQDQRAQQAFDMQQQQMQAEAAKQQQYNALLAEYLGPNQAALASGMQQPAQQAPQNALLSQLYQMDPARTQNLVQFQQQQQQAAQAQQQEEAQQVVRSAQFVLQSEAPKQLLQVAFPDLVSGLAEQGVDIAEMDDDQVRELANRTIAQYGPMAGMGPAVQAAENPFAKINPAEYTRESVRAFERSGNFGDLVPVEKPDTEAGDKLFQRANVLRDEYNAANKDFNVIEAQYGNILATSRRPSAAGDISLITSYMKMLDPASTVREGEFANAENAGGIPSKVRATYNKLLTGERLSPEMRTDFVTQSGALFGERQKQADRNVRRYTDLAKRAGVDPMDVVGSMGQGEPRDFATVEEAEAANLPVGTKITIGGRAATVQ
jgi:hypothetical protein